MRLNSWRRLPLYFVPIVLFTSLTLIAALTPRLAHAQGVAPTCPSGYFLKGNSCVRGAPAPSCPSGYTLSGGQCVAGGAAPSNGPWTFIVRRALGIRNAGELDGAYICLVSGSASETAVTGYFQAKGMAFGPIAVSSEQQAISGYEQNDCDVLVRDARDASVTLSGLARPSDHVILADQIGGSSASAPAPVRPALPQPVDVAYPLQSELKRLGCLTGPVDGIWGGGSRAALQRFSGQAGLNLGSEPSQNAVDEARSRPAGFCQPVQVAPPPPVTYTPSQPVPPTVTKKKRCSAVKYAFTRGNTCACSDRRIFTGSACVRP